MRCKEIRYQLPDHVRGVTPDEVRNRIEDHLLLCPACQQEARSLKVLIGEFDQVPTWEPAGAYWRTILPNVHKRINEHSVSFFPNRITRFALPVAAAIAVFFVTTQFVPWPGSGMAQDIGASIRQMPDEDLRDFTEQQSIVGAIEPLTSPGDRALNTDDFFVLRELFQTGEQIFAYDFRDQDTIYDTVSDQDVDELVPLLEKNIQSSTD